MKQKLILWEHSALLSFMIMLIFGLSALAQNDVNLTFSGNKTFKIVQFTDTHWSDTSENCSKTAETIQKVLESEHPDLVIVTGDVVVNSHAVEGWISIAKIFQDAKIPWAVTLGNHDSEPGITQEEIFDLLVTQPYFVGQKGPDIYGCGNYTLTIKASSGNSIAAVLYCFDSNTYWLYKEGRGYDWIRFDQIDWYRKTSESFTALNNKIPIPSLAFFHIPLPEFYEVVNDSATMGIKNEGIASAKINSGLFASLYEKKDVMGVFVGHDHDNNFIGINQGIALAFGQVTGADAYGSFERGARIIELHEGEFSFNSWIRTREGITFQFSFAPAK